MASGSLRASRRAPGAAIDPVVVGVAGDRIVQCVAETAVRPAADQDQVLDIGAKHPGPGRPDGVVAFAGLLDHDVA